ncbi:hypothetical protein PC129_g21838 [Phytophthora cactorum]|uniref:Uncharacterized protein n=1 Tax=Phytophthora cactorum TaxID=29920 RepID=A0A8T1CSK3_9STRA|nr:hypothetical protein Pcac1_g4758 [Phytophthora cactorum]KAG2805522.1 hypothetical protein PC112_g18242 [Phytophthora cactorum]KAG2875029.1 hypothetical protein PC114_g24948 [Phytophthora cactorum]KAG2881635.1 hypothetical protein PC115_g22168 [Phytophthora cactorum]KAG2927402.1 hypothetical protein PC117_g14605 [Phytophthora cactorum]
MVALRTINNRAVLHEYTLLSPLRLNVTRWSSTFEMVDCYVRFRNEVKQGAAVSDIIPKAAMYRCV